MADVKFVESHATEQKIRLIPSIRFLPNGSFVVECMETDGSMWQLVIIDPHFGIQRCVGIPSTLSLPLDSQGCLRKFYE